MIVIGGRMETRVTRLGLILALAAPITLADFRYDQSSRMTGGAMMSMMKLAAKFSKNAMEPVNSTIAVKGNRMVMNHGKTATIYDLDKETITEVNFEKSEYSVVTFAEMKAFFEKNAAKGAKQAETGSQDVSINIDVKDTGKTDTIAGMKAKEMLMTMTFEASNPQTGKSGEMRMEMSNWLAPKLPGYDEIAAFYQRLSAKMNLAAMVPGAMQGGMGKGMAEATKKMSAMEGVPVLQIVRMMPTDPEQLKQMQAMQQAQDAQQAQQAPSGGQVAEQAAGQAAAGAVAGRLGRLGGLGSAGIGGLGGLRRKKQEEAKAAEPPPPVAAAAPTADPGRGSFSDSASLMEMTIESKNFSSSSVDEAMLAVPGGFKQVKASAQK